jgi:hypothetical protein
VFVLPTTTGLRATEEILMQKLVVRCEVDGNEVGVYEFDCSYISRPQKLSGGPITIYFDPDGDVHHQMEINSLPSSKSKTIKGGNSAKAST